MSELEIKTNIRELADILMEEVTLNDSGIIEVNPGAFEKTLEHAGIDGKHYKKIKSHEVDVFNAAAVVVGELANPAMKKNKTLDKVSIELPAMKDKISHVYYREKETNTAGNGTTLHYGYMTSSFITDLGRDKGDLKKIRRHFSEQATAMFGKKK